MRPDTIRGPDVNLYSMGDIMTIQCKNYDYDSQQITIGLDQGGDVTCDMNTELFSYYGEQSDIELYFHDSDLERIGFRVGGAWRSGLQIVQWCEANHDAIRRETEAESDDKPYIQADFL